MAADEPTRAPIIDQTQAFDFAGWGEARRLTDLGHDPVEFVELGVSQPHKLGQWQATAICGNDITSSVLYVSALSIGAAGVLAPVALLMVAAVLYLFRKVYAEVGSALPLNGGTYTVLLNTTNKKLAAGAACLTLLSYVATAVISANEAMHYLHTLWAGLDVIPATVAVLGLFAFLNIIGIAESAGVALLIFAIHMVALTLLVVFAAVTFAQNPAPFSLNAALPNPGDMGLVPTLFVGFSAAMLGISGFESSANFIEEQKPGVFPKTLRNMWIAVSIFNPLICFLALGVLSRAEINANHTNLLSLMADRSAGRWLATLISVDAVLVLSGAVLTSYVGVTGLVRRMSLDRCLPQFLLQENRWRRTNHWIIISFFLFCCSILFITHGDVTVLAGVYAIAFLCVMALFAMGNILLKQLRSRLPRSVRAGWPSVSIALIAVLIGLAGNLSTENMRVFSIYFGVVAGTVAIMFLRIQILQALLFVLRGAVLRIETASEWLGDAVVKKIDDINDRAVIYFTKGDNMATLNQAALYVQQNEQTRTLIVVHVFRDESEIPVNLASQLATIDGLYPRLRIDFLAVRGEFGPAIIERLSRRLGVPKNYMFIGTPGDHFPHEVSELGGVRLVL